jgi:hypothetical protein
MQRPEYNVDEGSALELSANLSRPHLPDNGGKGAPQSSLSNHSGRLTPRQLRLYIGSPPRRSNDQQAIGKEESHVG